MDSVRPFIFCILLYPDFNKLTATFTDFATNLSPTCFTTLTSYVYSIICTILRTLYIRDELCTLVLFLLLVARLISFCPNILDSCCLAFSFCSYLFMFLINFSSWFSRFLNSLIICYSFNCI